MVGSLRGTHGTELSKPGGRCPPVTHDLSIMLSENRSMPETIWNQHHLDEVGVSLTVVTPQEFPLLPGPAISRFWHPDRMLLRILWSEYPSYLTSRGSGGTRSESGFGRQDGHHTIGRCHSGSSDSEAKGARKSRYRKGGQLRSISSGSIEDICPYHFG